jgi:hypothetical protein
VLARAARIAKRLGETLSSAKLGKCRAFAPAIAAGNSEYCDNGAAPVVEPRIRTGHRPEQQRQTTQFESPTLLQLRASTHRRAERLLMRVVPDPAAAR